MFGNRAVTFDSGCVVRPFGMKVAEHIQRDHITRIIVDNFAIGCDGIANLSLGKVALGVAHRLSFIEHRSELMPGKGNQVF